MGEAKPIPDRGEGNDTRGLVAAASLGDRQAVGELLARHLPALRVFVRLQIGPVLRLRESASDLVQSACRELLEHLDGFEYRGEEAFKHWLFTAALNKIREHNRYHRAERRDIAREQGDAAHLGALYGSLLTPSRITIARETVERLEAAFDQLPPDYREVIVLCRIVGLAQAEVATRMGRSVDSVRNLLLRALAQVSALADRPDAPTPP
jgi:RNA polymerase sigma-70 factor (ECF subfamily)